MTLKEYAAATHVRVNILDRNTNPVDTALAQSGVKPRIALTVPHFSVVPQVVANTGYVATLSQRLARVYVRSLPLAIRTLPIAVPPRPLRMVWHQRTDADEGARFLRALVREATA
jgi:DNA-binding transcriptional LysR family regulator